MDWNDDFRITTFRCGIQQAWKAFKTFKMKNQTLPSTQSVGPAKSRYTRASKRPARCEDTISPDTFHQRCIANRSLYLAGLQTDLLKYNGF